MDRLNAQAGKFENEIQRLEIQIEKESAVLTQLELATQVSNV